MTTVELPDTPGHYGIVVYAESPQAGEQAELTMAREMMRAVAKANQLDEKVIQLTEETSRLSGALAEKDRLYAEALAEIERLKKPQPPVTPPAEPPVVDPKPTPDPVPPVIVLPDPKPPTVPAQRVFPFNAVYFERDKQAVNTAAAALVRANYLVPYMEFAAECPDITDFIMHNNQVDADLGMLLNVTRRLNRRLWHSPMQSYWNSKNIPAFTKLLKTLHDGGMYGLILDDAQKVPASVARQMFDVVDQVLPGIPILASFGATSRDDGLPEGDNSKPLYDNDYPRERYARMEQWFLDEDEPEKAWFPKWAADLPSQIFVADIWRRSDGYIHSPERLQSMVEMAMELKNSDGSSVCQGIAWYTMVNPDAKTEVRQLHNDAKAKNKSALTHWEVMQRCSARYQSTFEIDEKLP
ncbi:MAG: hypothetical protein E6Q97_12150 [Desulfurellales bacterium]|nr:MAG: hypothetical protein E6Q97_12150 [Desulfurellales bacterium]